MAFLNVNRCQHIKINGTQCGSPALRRRRHCFFHRRAYVQSAKIERDYGATGRFVLPILEDANSVQVALMHVLQLVASDRIEAKRAGLLLYGLQTASANLRNADFEVEEMTDIVIDQNDVGRTAMGGPQWFEEDYREEDGKDDRENEEEDEKGEEEDVEELAAAEPEGAQPAKTVEQISKEEARRRVRGVVEKFVIETMTAAAARNGVPALAGSLGQNLAEPVQSP